MDLSLTILCPSCKAVAPAEAKFCPACGKPMLCSNPHCSAPLVANAKFCYQCGQPIAAHSVNGQQNTIERRRKRRGDDYDEYEKVSVSDYAASLLVPFMTGQYTVRHPHRSQAAARNDSDLITPSAPAITGSLFDISEEAIEEPTNPSEVFANATSVSGAARLFTPNGGFLAKLEADYKGKTWAEQQRRFILLYASAYRQHFGKPVPSKEHFKSAAEKASVIDNSNFAKYLTALTNKELVGIEDGYVLGNDGEKTVTAILAEMENPQSKPGHAYWSRTTADKVERHRLDSEEKEQVKKWAEMEVEFDQLDPRNIKHARDYAILALWLLTVHLKVAEAVRWNEAYYYLKDKIKAISATPSAFSRTLARKGNENYFRTSGDQYFLTQEAINLVDGWRQGKPVETLKDEKDE